jgi:acyl carrier protein
MENILEDIKELILKHTGKTKINLDRNTRLYKDLRIDGDDAFELLRDFSNMFEVDMSDFKFGEYFSPEGTDILGAIVSLLKNKPKLKELTLGDMEKAVIEKKL